MMTMIIIRLMHLISGESSALYSTLTLYCDLSAQCQLSLLALYQLLIGVRIDSDLTTMIGLNCCLYIDAVTQCYKASTESHVTCWFIDYYSLTN